MLRVRTIGFVMKLVVSKRPCVKKRAASASQATDTETRLTSENNAYEGENIAVAEGTHDVHLSHEVLFSLTGRRLFQHFDSNNLRLLAVLSSQFTYNIGTNVCLISSR
jgi:hypothetical protein